MMVKKDARLSVFDSVDKHSEFVFRCLVIPESDLWSANGSSGRESSSLELSSESIVSSSSAGVSTAINWGAASGLGSWLLVRDATGPSRLWVRMSSSPGVSFPSGVPPVTARMAAPALWLLVRDETGPSSTSSGVPWLLVRADTGCCSLSGSAPFCSLLISFRGKCCFTWSHKRWDVRPTYLRPHPQVNKYITLLRSSVGRTSLRQGWIRARDVKDVMASQI